MPLPFDNKVPARLQTHFVTLGIRRGELQNGLAANRAHPCRGSSGSDAVFKVVHVIEGGNARLYHLRAGQSCPKLNKVWVDELTLNRHHVANQPDIQPPVICQASQQGHRRMSMSVDKAGDDNPIPTVNCICTGVLIQYLHCWATRDYAISLDGNRPIDRKST